MAEKVRVHIFVSGRVQGVFFRDNTCQRAQELGITGWVRNLPDGRVEAVFEGEKEQVDQMTDWIRQGPAFAQVNDFRLTREDYQGEFDGFEIKH